MRLNNDQVEGHVRPRKLGELEAVVAFLERADEEDKACQGDFSEIVGILLQRH